MWLRINIILNFLAFLLPLKEWFMFKQCKTENSKKRQLLLENTFFELLKTKYYENITVSEISEKANVPRKAFYRYFDCKEDILSALISHTLEGYQEHYLKVKPDRRTMKGELKCFFEFWILEPRKTLLKVLNKNSLLGHLNKFSLDYENNNYVNASKFLPGDLEGHRTYVFNFAISGLMAMMLDWFNKGCKTSTDEMAEIASRMISKPLFPDLESVGIYKE